MLKRIIIACVVVVSAFFSSCTKEDLSSCNTEVHLKLSYLLNNQQTNLFGDGVNEITVFVFDANGHYYSTFSDKGKHLTNDYVMTLPLPVGKYSLLVWGGDMSSYQVVEMTDEINDVSRALTPGQTTLEQFRLLLNEKENRDALKLYYGKTIEVESKRANDTIYPIEFIKNSNTIRVNFTGLDNLSQSAQSRTGQTSMFDVTITAHNGRYDYENNIPSAAKTVLYRPHIATDTIGELTYDSNMLRLMVGREPMLRVVNRETGVEICNFNLVEAIMRDPKYTTQEDLDREDFFPFEFSFNPDLSVSISINGWSIIDVIPEL